MSVTFDFHLIENDLLVKQLDQGYDGESIVAKAQNINEEIYDCVSQSECSWMAFTFKEIENKIPNCVKTNIEDYISRFSAFGVLDKPAPFNYSDKSKAGDRPGLFLIMNHHTVSSYYKLYKKCDWRKLEPVYEVNYQKNDPGETFSFFFGIINSMHKLILYAKDSSKTLIGRVG